MSKINDTINAIELINSIAFESQLTVLESMMSCIDKNELIQDYCYSDEYTGNMFLESMFIFMESKNRERDRTPRNEISKWMQDNGYWYEGNKSNKKKACMRMYHFLQQHKFDPKTETYESDIDDGKGGKKRIKLDIDKGDPKYRDMVNAVKRGKNAFYDPEADSISIGSKTLKDKQAISQLTLKHEEKHAESYNKGGGKPYYASNGQSIKDPDILRAVDHLIEYQDHKGYHINHHDYNTEELNADLGGAKNAKFRTKEPGKTRKANIHDIERHFNRLSSLLTDIRLDSLSRYKSLKGSKEDLYENINDILNTKTFTSENIDRILYNVRITNRITDTCLTFLNNLEEAKKKIADINDDIKFKEEQIEKIKSGATTARLSRYSPEDHIPDVKEERDNIIVFYRRHIDHLKKRITRITEDINDDKEDIRQNINYYEKGDFIDFNFLKIIRDLKKNKKLSKHSEEYAKELFESKVVPKLEDECDTLRKEIDKLTKKIESHGRIDESTQMRMDFVKKYVNEYFESLYYDYEIFIG